MHQRVSVGLIESMLTYSGGDKLLNRTRFGPIAAVTISVETSLNFDLTFSHW